MTNNNNKYSPELRFPEFQDKGEWNVIELGQFARIVMGQSPSSKNYNSDRKGIPLLQGNADIKDRKQKLRIYTTEVIKTCDANDIIMTVRAPVGTISRALFFSCIGRGVCAIKTDSDYLYHYLVSIEQEWEKYASGSTFSSIILDQVYHKKIIIPQGTLEQKKIADCLSSLDIYLDTTKRKLELLKEYKKGLMQQLFPRNGKNVPELRFPEFTGEWAEKRLGNSFKERKEKNRNDLPLLSLGEKGLLYQSDTNRKDNSNTDKSKYLRIALGDIAYNTMRMWQGRCVFVDKEGIVSPAYTVCQPKEGIDSMFHYYLFKTHKMIEKFHRNSQGLVSDTLNLKFETFSKIKYFLPPSLTEQKKIADFLSKLDELIISESQQLEALNAHKNGLMQRLFPKISTQDL